MFEWLNKFVDWLAGLVSQFFEWWLEFAKWYLLWIWSGITTAGAWIIEQIPVPDFFALAGQAVSHIPPEVVWWLDPWEMAVGLTIVISAYSLRFVIRRLPLFG